MPAEKSPSPVSIVRCPDYGPEMVFEAIKACLAPMGGMEAFVRPGGRVLIKPNLVSPYPPEAAVCTHPEIVRAVGALVLRAGGHLFLGDSPGVASMRRVLDKSEISKVILELGIKTVPFTRPVKVPVPGNGIRRHVFLAGEALGFDLIINLPRFKTHSRMLLTLSVKNMFGTVVGTEKAGWHLKAGETEAFADLLLDVCLAASPGLSILDGIVAMEGNGPSSGDPFSLGLLFASPSPLALDRVAGEIAGVPAERHPILMRALERNLHGAGRKDFQIIGPDIHEITHPVALPSSVWRIEENLPSWMKRLVAGSAGTFPVLDEGKCVSCGQCAEACPVDAIALFGGGRKGGIVDRGKCIRCYCCQEMCPHGAIGLVRGRLLGLLRKVGLS